MNGKKIKIHPKHLFPIFLLILSFSVIFIPINLNTAKNENITKDSNPYPSQTFTDSPPIKISSDSDFLSHGFPGTGSVEDPYRIENLKIKTLDLASKPDGIMIQNVSKSFIIQNCRIWAPYAIKISSCSSNSIQLINNWCKGGGNTEPMDIGILVGGIKAHAFKAINNTCLNNWDGMNINSALYSVIENNTLTRNHIGLRVESNISFSRVIHNYYMNNYDGMWISNSIDVFVKNNYIYNNVVGIFADSTSFDTPFEDCRIVDNLFDNNTSYAIILRYPSSIKNHIYRNTIINNNKNGGSQAKDEGQNNLWYNESLKEGNYWSNWVGFGSYHIDGSANSIDPYPLEKPLQSTFSNSPFLFLGRLILIILLISITSGISIAMIVISEFYLKKRQKRINIK
ncbi:MAG: NosD domain-containing protein, partial [Candidatus Lokiarchaeota archaeon]